MQQKQSGLLRDCEEADCKSMQIMTGPTGRSLDGAKDARAIKKPAGFPDLYYCDIKY